MMSKVLTIVAVLFASVLSQGAFAMESRVVEIKKSEFTNSWVMQKSGDLRTNAMMIGATEAVVDKIDALNFAKDYVCDAKYRDMGSFARASLAQVMVYDISNCVARTR